MYTPDERVFGNVSFVVASVIVYSFTNLPSMVYIVNTPVTGASTVKVPDDGFG